MFLYLLSVGVLIWYIVLRWKNRKSYRLSSHLKSNLLCLPIVGHSYLFLLGNAEDRMNAFQRFGRIAIDSGGLMGLWLGSRFFVNVADPEALELIMKTSLLKDDIVDIAHELFGNGSIFAPVHIWRPRRKVIAPTFSPKNLNQFVEVFSEQSSVMVERLTSVAGQGAFSIWKYLTTYTMDSVCETTLGIKMNAQRNPNQPFLEAFENHCQMAAARLCQPPIVQYVYKYMPIHTLYMKHIKCMWGFVDKLIKKKREDIKKKAEKTIKENKTTAKERKTFLELYIEASGGTSGFTDLELREETLVLLLAGTDTSAVGSAFASLMLAKYPEVQQKVFEEIKEVVGDSNMVSAGDLLRLKYLEAVIKESLRLYPPVPIIVRKVDKDITLPNGLELPKDTSILINIWAVHHNQHYWGKDVEEFRPERFLEGELKHPTAFIPFSYGPRSCLGYQYAMMSMKTALATLVRNYRIKTCDTDSKGPLRVKYDVMMKHVDNFELQLECRS